MPVELKSTDSEDKSSRTHSYSAERECTVGIPTHVRRHVGGGDRAWCLRNDHTTEVDPNRFKLAVLCPRGMNVPFDCLCLPFLSLPHAVDDSSRLFYVSALLCYLCMYLSSYK